MATVQETINKNSLKNRGGSLSFPGDILNAQSYTRLVFSKYNRLRPSATVKNEVTSTIILPVPESIGDAFGANWNQAELGMVGAVADIAGDWASQVQSGRSIFDIVKGAYDNVNIDTGRKAAILAMALTPKNMRDGQIQTAVSQGLGAVINPHLSLMYSGQPLRQHNLEWRVSPRSEKEAVDLGKIIESIRRAVLPQYSESLSKFALDYPDTVEVEFVGVDAQYKTKIFKSAVTGFVTDYAPGRGPSFYKNGRPVLTTIALSLVETEIVTRSDFDGTANTR